MIRVLAIDPADPTPLHAQVERGIRVAIATGRLARGAQLPTVRQLAVDLRVNANTIAKVYAALEREGILLTRRGVGTFVAEAASPATQEPHRNRQLRAAVDRLLTEAASLGFSAAEVEQELAARIKGGR